ncbi:MIP/aquaporin family protein [Acidipila sp. EB88]|uniref:MIP/aquaporin family protein n=1 Tax=Acidipila sp. EB88 TaxID=2305226 RepID=UPI000FAECD49|nr:aquaporin family protein [Acidipila sp. EB88]
MFLVCLLIVVLESPTSVLFRSIPDDRTRLVILAAAIGVVVSVIIQSPWGKRSGAHLNPAVTIAFLRLRRIQPWNAFFYVLSHFVGAFLGVMGILLTVGSSFRNPPVHYAVTVPGPSGDFMAFLAETLISALLMALILFFIRSSRRIAFTGVAVGALIAILITVESPISGTSMNPARTLATAFAGRVWQHLWIYLFGPLLGMLIAAEVHRHFWPEAPARDPLSCAKLLHPDTVRCIHCGHQPRRDSEGSSPT